VGIPDQFCWSKYGAEAGEGPASILNRKERERAANGGTFLWGIGNSIRPSLEVLLRRVQTPAVLFTPMRSRAAAKDVAPAVVGRWTRATSWTGEPFELPAHTLVTSGAGDGDPPTRHFALVCRRDEPIPDGAEGWLDERGLRNLRTGSVLGASQVTAVVTTVPMRDRRPRYTIAFSAALVEPYMVELRDWEQLQGGAVESMLLVSALSTSG
jgi:hypothetical protein